MILTVSQAMRREIVAHFQLPDTLVRAIPLAASELFRPTAHLAPPARPYFLFIGTLEPRKNQLALVKLFARVAAKHPNAKLVLVGDGPSRPAIEAAVAELGIRSKVRLLGFRRDVPDILPLADVYVHASLLENCPMVLLEAARAGLPVAAVPAGGVPELLEQLHGTPIDLEDETSLDSLLSNAANRSQSGRLAREAFDRHFTREVMIDAYVRVLELSETTEGRVRP